MKLSKPFNSLPVRTEMVMVGFFPAQLSYEQNVIELQLKICI